MATVRIYLILLPAISLVQASVENRVIYGLRAKIEQFPYIVSLHRRYNLICGGSLIKPNIVLTAAHCIEDIYPYTYSIYRIGAGDHRRIIGKQYRSIDKMISHPNYNYPYRYSHDIAIIIIHSPFELSSKIGLIKIAPASLQWPGNEAAEVAGWGRTHQDTFPNNLYFARLDVISKTDCLNVLGSNSWGIGPAMQCAGKVNGGEDSCAGDSGGPLVYNKILIGIVSWGPSYCGRPRFPGIYTEVAPYNGWITQYLSRSNMIIY